MGFLSAFLRGVAGQGVLEMGARWDRLDAEARAEARAAREREDRQAFLEAEKSRDRALRQELADQAAAQRALGTSRRSGSGSGTGGTGGTGGAEDDDRITVGRLMSDPRLGGMDEATARRYIDASRTGGENPLQREEMVPEQIDEGDRMRTVSVRRMVPDAEKWMAINRIVGQSLIEEPTIRKSNYEQYQKGLTQEQIRDLTAQGIAGKEIGPTQGALVLGGKDPTHPGGTNVVTGLLPKGGPSLDLARAGSEGAQAGAANALAAKRRVEAKGEELPKDRIARTREERLDRQKNIDQLQKERADARESGDDERANELTKVINEKLRAENSGGGALPAASKATPQMPPGTRKGEFVPGKGYKVLNAAGKQVGWWND